MPHQPSFSRLVCPYPASCSGSEIYLYPFPREARLELFARHAFTPTLPAGWQLIYAIQRGCGARVEFIGKRPEIFSAYLL
jgi:hypothetical protein